MQAFSCNISPFSSSSSSSCSAAAAAASSPAASAASRAASSFFVHSAEALGRLPSAASTIAGAAAAPPAAAAAVGASPGATATVKPFDRELFRAFISAASRLFCDDEQIVLVDFLAHHEKAFTERELSDRLRWAEKRVREACAALEKLMLVAKEHHVPSSGSASSRRSDNYSSDIGSLFSPATRGGGDGSGQQQQQQTASTAPCYYRVSPFCFLVFYYRLQRMEQQVETQRRNAETRDVFFCPSCRMQYDALEAQLLDVHPLDAHFLCKFCNERLEHEDSKLLLQQAISLQERCDKQLHVLKTLVRRGWNMQIPTFPPFTRAEKNQQKLKNNEEEEEQQKKRLAALHQENINGQNPGSVLKQQQQGAGTPLNGSRSAPRTQPSWITGGTAGGRGGEEAAAAGSGDAGAAATAAGSTATARSDSKYGVSAYREGISSGGWGQLLNSKAAAAGRLQQPASVGSSGAATAPGGRHQIKFAVKNTGLGGKPGSVIGSRLRAARAMQHSAAGSPGVKTAAAHPPASATATSAEAAESVAAGNATAAAGPGGEAAAAAKDIENRRESDSSSSSLPSLPGTAGANDAAPPGPSQEQQQKAQDEEEKQQQSATREEDATAAGVGTPLETADDTVQRDDFSAISAMTASADIDGGVPLLYVSRLDREMPLEEAAEYQQEMTAEEHEKFMELQAMYLDEI